MTVIHTTDDLIRLLEENDEFRQAVRRHVLSDELVQLPERLARFATRMETFVDEQKQFNKEQNQFNKEQNQFNKEQNQFNKEMREFKEDQLQFNEEQRQSNQRMETAIGELRGNVARQVVGAHSKEIAEGMGFQVKRLLARPDLFRLLVRNDPGDLTRGERQSFFRADLVLEVTDPDGSLHYIAIEASYTADKRDTDRALRNAELMETFTGHRAHALIASVRNVSEIQGLIDDGTVSWYAPRDRRLHAGIAPLPKLGHGGVEPIRSSGSIEARRLLP